MNDAPTPAQETQPWYRRSKPRRNIIIIVSTLLVLTLLYSFVPTYTARYIVANQLDKFGIEHSGVETLKINPWTMEVWIGPVQFWSGDIEHGQLGEVGLKLNLLPVFQKHAMVESVLVRGIDIYVARAEDNTITLNGIPLNQFFPAEDTTRAEQADDESTPWGTGLGAFELQNSRLIFKEKTGGTLTVQLDSLMLNEFISWTPDQPGAFQLKGRVNDIELDWSGQARPFAEQITVTANAVTRQAELPKIIEFTGPLGQNPMERQSGVYNSEFQHEFTLFKTGRLEGKTVGKLEVIGADYDQDEKFLLSVERAEVDLDTAYALTEDNDLEINGQISMDVMKTTGRIPEDSVFGLEQVRVELNDLTTTIKDDRSLSVAVKPRINLTNGNFTGQIQLSMDGLLDVLRQLQSLSAGIEVSKEQTGLADFAGDEVTLPRSTISIAQLQSSSPKLELTTSAGNVTLDHAFNSEASGIEIAALKRSTTIATANTDISSLQLQSGEGHMALKLSGNTVLKNSQQKGPFGEGTFDSIETVNEKLDLQVESGNIAVEAAVKAVVKGSRIRMYQFEELPETSIGIGAVTTHLKKGKFAVAQQRMQWQGTTDASIDNFTVSVAKGKVASTKFERLALSNASADQKLNINVDALTLAGLDVFLTRKYIDDIIATAKDEKVTGKQAEGIEAAKEPEKPDSTKTVKPELRLGRVALVKGAKVRFLDEKVEPDIKVDTIIESIELRDVDMKNPEKQAQAELVANINEFTNIELKGWATNVGPNADLEVTGKIDNLELHTYSPYAAEFGGVYLESGQFSNDTEVKAKQGNLDGAIKLNVQDLKFEALSEEDAKRLSEKAGFPIETVVGLLQDKNGNINLKLPVEGTVVNPSVNITSAISKAISGTLKSIFPPTMIAGMVSSKKEGGGITFEPIKFKPGANKLDAAAREYANELAKLLRDRPVLSLKVCGATNADDFFDVTLIKINKPTKTQAAAEQRLKLIETHKPKLIELAVERTQAVRRYLIKEKGLDAKRVGECRPKFNAGDKGPPRVDITL
jgi:hypothetical protein